MILFSFIVKGILISTGDCLRKVYYNSQISFFDYSTNCRKLVEKCLLFRKMKFIHRKCYTNCIRNGRMEHNQGFGSTLNRYLLHKTITMHQFVNHLGTDGHPIKHHAAVDIADIQTEYLSVNLLSLYIFCAVSLVT